MKNLDEILEQTELFGEAEKMLLTIVTSNDPTQAILDLDMVFINHVVGIALKVKEKEEDYEYCHHLLTGINQLIKSRETFIANLTAVG